MISLCVRLSSHLNCVSSLVSQRHNYSMGKQMLGEMRRFCYSKILLKSCSFVAESWHYSPTFHCCLHFKYMTHNCTWHNSSLLFSFYFLLCRSFVRFIYTGDESGLFTVYSLRHYLKSRISRSVYPRSCFICLRRHCTILCCRFSLLHSSQEVFFKDERENFVYRKLQFLSFSFRFIAKTCSEFIHCAIFNKISRNAMKKIQIFTLSNHIAERIFQHCHR